LKNIYPEQLATLKAHHSKLLDLQGVSERFKSQLMRLEEAAQNERARKGAGYYLGQLALLNAQLPALLEVEIDNKEVSKSVDEIGKELTEALRVKVACLRTVKEKGYSVQAVQKAKVDAMMKEDSGKRKVESGKRRAESGAKQRGERELNAEHLTLHTTLRQWRAAKAKEEGVAPYMILQQKALQSIASNAPRTPAELKRQLGVGPKTLEKYGNEILEIILQTVMNDE
jgi:superfamily II DNA helicase RecQ